MHHMKELISRNFENIKKHFLKWGVVVRVGKNNLPDRWRVSKMQRRKKVFQGPFIQASFSQIPKKWVSKESLPAN